MLASSDLSAELILAVDAGGTKTVACLARPTGPASFEILGRGRGTGANPLSVGFDKAVAVVSAAAAEAAGNAGLAGAPVARAVLAVAGAADPAIASEFVRRTSEANLARRISVVSDILPILAAGVDGVGVALIAGTGSVAYGRDESGRTIRCGGWGYLLGDEGGGFAIGRAALRCALEDLETSPAGRQSLTAMLLDEFRATRTNEITAAIHTNPDPRAAIAALAPKVCRSAEMGDPAARQILAEAARDLASLAVRVVRTLGLDVPTHPIAVAGGVLVGSEYLRSALVEQLSAAGIQPEIHLIADPLEACLRLLAADSPGLAYNG